MPRAPETRGSEFRRLAAGWPARGMNCRKVAFEPACQCRVFLILAHEREVVPKPALLGQVSWNGRHFLLEKQIAEQDLDKLAILAGLEQIDGRKHHDPSGIETGRVVSLLHGDGSGREPAGAATNQIVKGSNADNIGGCIPVLPLRRSDQGERPRNRDPSRPTRRSSLPPSTLCTSLSQNDISSSGGGLIRNSRNRAMSGVNTM